MRAEYTSRLIDGTSPDEDTVDDIVYEVYTDAGHVHEARLITTNTASLEEIEAVEYETTATDKISIDANGVVTWLHDELLRQGISVTARTGSDSRSIVINVGADSGSVRLFSDFVEGSFLGDLNSQMMERIDGITPDASTFALFTTKDHVAATYVRSTIHWCADLNEKLTCKSVWASNPNLEFWHSFESLGLTRIGKNLAVGAHHVAWAYTGPNVTVRFIAEDGTPRDMIVADHRDIGGDIELYKFKTDFPESIYKAKLLPTNFMEHFGVDQINGGSTIKFGCPALWLDQRCKVALKWEYHFSASSNYLTGYFPPLVAAYQPFAPSNGLFPGISPSFESDAHPGDSSTPVFWVIDDELVLLKTLYGPGYGTCTGMLLAGLISANTSMQPGVDPEFEIIEITNPTY